nr:MAG TPA: tail completion protein [Caudoviricetes sp.]
MFNDLIDAISKRLLEYFPESVPNIYSENIEQGFNEPCFYISLINSTNKNKLGPGRSKRYKFDIMYFNNNLGNDDLNTMGDKLSTVLEDIQIGDALIHGFDIEYEVKDNKLHFFVEYPVLASYEVEKVSKMASLKERIDING